MTLSHDVSLRYICSHKVSGTKAHVIAAAEELLIKPDNCTVLPDFTPNLVR